jgi:hypothetical protein
MARSMCVAQPLNASNAAKSTPYETPGSGPIWRPWLASSRSCNELRVCAARSRRRSSVGRTRGVGRRLALWRFHQGRSERGLIIAARPAWFAWYDRSIAAGSGAFKRIGNVIWSKVGPSAALVTGNLRGVPRHAAARPDDGGGGIRTDHGAMACCGVCGPSVRMKTSRP